MPFNKLLHARPDLRHGNVAQAEWLGKTAVVGARFVGAGAAFDHLRRRVEWRKPFVELRPKQGESRQATARG